MDGKFNSDGDNRMKVKYLFILFLLFIGGCAGRRPETPVGFTEKTIETEHFSIAVWEKNITAGEPLRIYIEGDGDPMPKQATALEFAVRDPSQNVIYVSRPCQYIWCKECSNPLIWGQERFHEEIVNEMKELIVYLAYKYKTPSLELVGYDGGGTMALILATKIPVARVITIGGILDTKVYAAEHDLAPINGLNPGELKDILARVPQTHYVGGRDTVTTRRMAERFVARLRNPKEAIVKVIPEATHTNWRAAPFDYYQ